MRTGFPAEAGGVGKELLGQIRLGEDIIPVDGGQGSLGSGQHVVHPVIGGIGDLVDLVRKLGELTGGFAALVLQHMGRQDKLIAVGNVAVDEVVQQRPLQSGAQAGVHPVAGTGQLDAPLIVNETQILAQIHMVLGGEVELVGLAEILEGLVVLLTAGKQVRVRQVGQAQHGGAVFGLDLVQLLGILGHLGLQLCHLGKNRGNVLSGLLQLGDFLGNLVLLCLQALGGRDQLPALLVQLQNPVYGCVAVHFLCLEPGLDCVGVFLNAFDVDHVFLPLFHFCSFIRASSSTCRSS